MAPIVHGLEVEYFDRINFEYLNIDDPATDKLKEQLNFRYQPHFFLIDGKGNVIQQWLGPVSEQDFREAFEAQLQ